MEREMMKVTVCELPDNRNDFAHAWEELVAHVRQQQSDLVLLPELPFSTWFARTPQFDEQAWLLAETEHDAMMQRLPELAPAVVLGTRPVTENGLHFNRGFSWKLVEGYRGVHDKYYFPNEEDFYERNWFDRNQRDFTPTHIGDIAIGFLICTEAMFNEWARYYGRQGVHIIAAPRASTSHERWDVALRMAALVSGAFVISSNRFDDHLFAGRSMVVHPEGDILASTSRQTPFVTVTIDLAESMHAKQTYPRDVLE